MTIMREGLLLNSKYIKMGREEGGSQTFLTQLPLVIVCHEFKWLCDGLKCRCSISCQAKSVSNSCQANI